MRGVLRGASTFVALVLVLTACSTSVDGQGAAGTTTGSAAPSASSSADFPSGSASGSASTSSGPTSPSVASSTPTYQLVTVRGSSSGRSISVRVYAKDTITDCAAHAYGTTMIRFLGEHQCRGAARVLGTTVVAGRTVVLSAISTGFSGTAADPYGVAGRFTELEKADGTGSINDLLREGHAIPGVASRIPDHEVFQVIGQDIGVTIFDAWYATGSTPDGDRALKALETDLFLTPLTTG